MVRTRQTTLADQPDGGDQLPSRAATAAAGTVTSELASLVWAFTADEPTFPELVERARQEFDGRAEGLARDVATLLVRWHKARLLLWL
jgi:coenzyme PQQ synthesis protein D (PqqD)